MENKNLEPANETKEKKQFTEPEMEIHRVEFSDIITASDGLQVEKAEDDGFGEIIDLDDFGL